MKVVDPLPFMGISSGLREVQLSEKDRQTLRAAAVILDGVRALMQKAEPDLDESELGTDIGLAWHTCTQLADDGKVDL